LKNYLYFLVVIVILTCLCNGILAQVSMPNAIVAVYNHYKINIDGNLNDSIWQVAPRITNFTQRELNYNQPVSERTEVAVSYNDEYLYIAVWCYDKNPQNIVAKELRRDFNYDIDDNFIVVIDTYNDKRNGFMFVTNPNSARADLQIFNNGGSSNMFWNGVWDVKTRITSEGWFAEFEIPLYTLKYPTQTIAQTWGINFERNIRYKREQALWQGWSRDNRINQVNQAGFLIGLRNLRNKQFVEVKPYGIAGANNLNGKRATLTNAGGDINYLLSPTYRLNLTFNTDFAQVEADQQQINLTRFPLFFPELREFFLEGDDYFNMNYGGNRIFPFYTRRIGLSDNLDPIPIIAGARILGKEQNSTIGLMSIQTAEAFGQPATNYSVGSWRQDVGRQSFFGIMSANRIDNQHWHTTTGINGRYSTAKFLGKKNIEIGAAFIKTHSSNIGYQPDGYAYRAFLSYPNDRIVIFASTQQSPAAFNPEIGLATRSNFREDFALVSLRPRPKNFLKWIRQFEFNPVTVTNTQYNDTRKMQSFEYGFQYFGFETKSGESIRLEHRLVGEGLIDSFRIRPTNVIIPPKDYWWRQNQAELRTFRGRMFSVINRITWGQYYTGNAISNRTDVLWRAGKYLNTSLRYEYNQINLPYGFLETHLFGNRIEYAINPNVFGSMLTQWNTAQNELNLNFRLQVIPKIGTDFFFIVNQIYDTQNNTLDARRSTIIGKLIWRFVI
jgi:hypothetical protein